MKLTKVRVFPIVCFFALCANATLFAQTLDLAALLDAPKLDELRKTRYVSATAYDKKNTTLQLCPNTPQGKSLTQFWNKPSPPNYVAESLTLIKKSAAQNDIKKVNRILHNMSTLKGIDYYSNSKKRREVLYASAHMLDAPETRRTIADLAETQNSGYLFLEDTGLGKCAYTVTFENTASEVSVRLLNLDPVKYVAVVGTKEQEMLMTFLVADVGTDLLVYSVVRANIPMGSLLEETMSKKILARMDGIVKWLSENYSK
ncbi:MAG: hypothetical protein Ta2A_06530 [Treponemataceae bacterium]|nr:MAG: hypothetical protein Ta2A_06530 [Treponemataceae bacterium]